MPDSSILLKDIAITTIRVLNWTLVSWLVGMLLGFAANRCRLLRILLLPVVNFMRHISPFCWLPLIILVAGIGELSVGITLFLALVFNAILMSMELLNSLPKAVVEQAGLDGATAWQRFVHIELPLCYGAVIDLFRVLWGVGWSVVVAAEMLGVSSGMGYRLLDFRYLLRYHEMIVYILIIGVIGVGTDLLLKQLKTHTSQVSA